jgi:hypothetical protein
MSHIVSIKTELLDVEAIKAACADLGLTFKADQKSYKWWGRSVGDYPLPAGFKASDLGTCEHAIGVPGTSWEIGVARARNADGTPGNGYTLLCDFYGSDGAPIGKALGCEFKPGMDGENGRPMRVQSVNFNRFTQAYAVAKATIEAKKRGFLVTRKPQPNGSVQLLVTGFR